MVRQLTTVELQAVLLVLRHQIDHCLAAIAGFAMNMLKQQQRRGATAIKQFAVACLYIQHLLRSEIAQENRQTLGIFFIQVFR